MIPRISGLPNPDQPEAGLQYYYNLQPGESVIMGIGFATEMPEGMFYWIAPRSGLASKYRIQVANAPGTVDPGYRGEACVIVVNHGINPFAIHRGLRIAQIIFQWAVFPELEQVAEHSELSTTERGSGGLGSTGLR
jgi:dUTP pyrophosphatase